MARAAYLQFYSQLPVRSARSDAMAEINKLSVEDALKKLRRDNASKSKDERPDEKIDSLDEEINRMRAQRLRLERHQSRKT
jgi:hypothetical protein